jgi:hypothetical protein
MRLSLVMQGVSKRGLQQLERWIVCTPLSVNVFVTLDTSNIWNIAVKLFLKHPVGSPSLRNTSFWNKQFRRKFIFRYGPTSRCSKRGSCVPLGDRLLRLNLGTVGNQHGFRVSRMMQFDYLLVVTRSCLRNFIRVLSHSQLSWPIIFASP